MSEQEHTEPQASSGPQVVEAETKSPVGDVPEHDRIEGREIPAGEFTDSASAQLAEYVRHREISFREALERYEPVDVHYDPVHGSYMVVADRGAQLQEPSTRELGFSSPSPFTAWTREEHNPKLRDKLGLREYYRMKRQDGAIRGSLRQFKGPILSANWSIVPASQSPRAKAIAEDVRDNLFGGLVNPWSSVLEQILLMCDYGFMVMEKVWTDQAVPGRVTLRKLAPRHPLDVRDWKYDFNGGPDGVVMEPTEMSGFQEGIFIPIEKLVIFSLEPEAGDLRGISILRSAYKHWFYRDTFYKIDAIQKERHGIGVPIIKLPPGFNANDKALADEMGRNLRTNERAHIVLPPGWEIMFAKLEGQPVDCLKSIEHHDRMIWLNVLAVFALDPKSTIDNADMFHRATRYVANTVSATMNHFVIRQFVDINYARNKSYPVLRARRIGEENEDRTRSFTIRNYVGSRVITPDDKLEEQIREELDLPPADEETARPVPGQGSRSSGGAGVPTPPSDPNVGLPRQQPLPPIQPPQQNAGTDASGG